MKTILIPTDFSEMANNAVLFASKFANKNKARVILLHTYNMPLIDGQSMNVNTNILYNSVDLSEFEMFRENNQKLRDLAQSKNVKLPELYHKLVLGGLTTAINECVQEEKVDFLVMGTSGADDWFSKLFGSNTDSVLLTTNVPTLVIPKNYQDDELLTIGFTTRFRDKDKPALKKTIEFANKLGMKVKCMYAETDDSVDIDETVKKWQSEFKADEVDFIVYPTNDVLDTVNHFIAHQLIDILVMVTYKRNFFEELFTKRFTQKVTHQVNVPILVLHA